MVTRQHDVSLEAFEAFIHQHPDRLFELIDGEIIEKVPTEEHGIIVLNIAGPLRIHVKGRRLGRVTTEGLHRLPDDRQNAYLPDVSFRSDLSLPLVREGAIPTMPDLAVEVQSPSQSDDFMAEKANYYLAHGSRMVWLVYPKRRVVEVHTRAGIDSFEIGEMLSGGDVIPGFELSVEAVFDVD